MVEKKRKNKSLGFLIKLFVALVTIVAVIFGVYFSLDRLIVPKYFKTYGINNMHDLVAMVKTLYNSPDESEIITNGYSAADLKSATKKFKEANFPMTDNGDVDYMAISEGEGREDLVSGEYAFTDREISAILDQMLSSENGVLSSNLPNIKYIETININLLEIIITPIKLGVDEQQNDVYYTDRANVSFTAKIDTSAVRNQMAKAMDTPLFLLNMIVPETLYITVDYDMQKFDDGEWKSDDGYISVNGRTAKDSQILLNLLIDFVFPIEDEMTVDKLCNEFGNIIILGLDVFGDVEVKSNVEENGSNGIILRV